MPNQTVQLEVLRDDKKRNISATLTTAPDDTPAKSDTVTQSKGPVLGIAIRNLAPAELSQLNVKGGVLIQEVKRGGAAAQSGMAAGDVVTHINNKVVKDTNDFVQAASELKKGQVARVGIIRQGTPGYFRDAYPSNQKMPLFGVVFYFLQFDDACYLRTLPSS